ncbi:hypothetical protein QFC19_000634 [Naganishia cerealis]|uniref:Uncharacterized protein n=1 Tax=Naganishia cerealis TaxID=610337 RepID=A0ACC2WLJ9_9TREE|nr:hypothetical protein QFC19_000634 [Naganishia cerealis]
MITPESLTIVGNSAGAVHVATYLYRDAIKDYELALAPLATDPTLLPDRHDPLHPSGAMLIGMPAHFRLATPDRSPVLFGYHCPELFGKPGTSEQQMRELTEERCPIGLRKRSGDRTRVGTMLADLDPEPEIAGPVLIHPTLSPRCLPLRATQSREFSKVYEEITGIPAQEIHIDGHNHISVPLGLGLGGKEEAWGHDLIKWINGA